MTNSSSPTTNRREESRGFIAFVTVSSTIFFAGTGLVCWTWAYFRGFPGLPGWWIIPMVLTATFILALMAGTRRKSPSIKVAYTISAVWVGFLNFFFFASLACWITDAISLVFGLGLSRPIVGSVFFGAAILAGAYGFLNALWLRVTRVTVTLPNLPSAWQGREVVLVSDLHLGNVRGAAFMRRVARKIMEQKPYAVFISGDMFDGPKADYDRMAAPCRNLSAPGGVYFVTGNHEEFADSARFVTAIQRAGVRVLHNEKVTVDGLQIVGVFDGDAEEPGRFKEILKGAALDHGRASILMSHRPSHLSIPEEAGISLQVSGHTHRGQVWPWCWVVFRVHGPFAYGLNRKGNLLVLTSSGAGTWGPPMRAGTKSEIVRIRLA